MEKQIEEKLKWLNDLLKIWEENESRNHDYVSFFDTKKLNGNDVKSILIDLIEKENNNIKHFCRSFINEIYRFGENYIFNENLFYEELYEMDMFLYELLKGYTEREINKNISCFKRFIRCYFAFAISDAKLNEGGSFQTEKITNEKIKEVINDMKFYDNYFYRGQTDYRWGIVPSSFRHFIFKTSLKTDGNFVDLSMLYANYSEAELIQKYNDTIAQKPLAHYSDLSIDFIAYMQHSLAYSPLIDITDKIEIGLQFALGNKHDVNNFLGCESSLFVFKIRNFKEHLIENEHLDNLNFNVKILNKKIIPGTIMEVEDINGKRYPLDFRTTKSTIKNLRPKFKIIDKEYNDRMRYQHGRFILFYDYTLVNDRILFNLNRDLDVIHYRILKSSKKGLYKTINNLYPQYSMDYLMEPYDYFKK